MLVHKHGAVSIVNMPPLAQLDNMPTPSYNETEVLGGDLAAEIVRLSLQVDLTYNKELRLMRWYVPPSAYGRPRFHVPAHAASLTVSTVMHHHAAPLSHAVITRCYHGLLNFWPHRPGTALPTAWTSWSLAAGPAGRLCASRSRCQRVTCETRTARLRSRAVCCRTCERGCHWLPCAVACRSPMWRDYHCHSSPFHRDAPPQVDDHVC